jgi:hypothetical protein
MKWFRRQSCPEDDERERELEEVAERVGEVEERAERVAQALSDRRRRNHWGETLASIARGGTP